MKIILQKFIAQAGCCSRRQAEEWIKKGRVFVNGKPAELGMKADETDEVKIGEKKLVLRKKMIYIKLNKPKGYVCTSRHFQGEKNVFDLLTFPQSSPSQGEGENKERLFVVGRLDKDSHGLVLLTNDGDLTQRLTHPKYEHKKKYIAQIDANFKQIDANFILQSLLKNGVDIGEGDGIVKAKEAKLLGGIRGKTSGTRGLTSVDGDKFLIVLSEGKKRQIRRMFGALGYKVVDLVRTGIGELELGDLKEGQWKYLNEEEIRCLTTAETPCGG